MEDFEEMPDFIEDWILFTRECFTDSDDWKTVCKVAKVNPNTTEAVVLYINGAEAYTEGGR